ncbi:MAG: hypothetical protein HUU37_03405 [Bdellovibrionales bacterium]|nr:hypothetical protein [Bdellovibrionales bacterium]
MRRFAPLLIMVPCMAFAAADDLSCGVRVELQVKAAGSPLRSRETVCLRADRSWALVEESCGRDFKKCQDSVLVGGPGEPYEAVPVGNPAFHLCIFLGGRPEFVAWRRSGGNSWTNTTACFLKDTFLDLDHLTEAWKKRQRR